MSLRPLVLVLCGVCAIAAEEVSVGDIVAAVRASLGKGDSDNSLAKTLHKWKISERLDDQVIEELESEGAGPKSVVELERLRDTSRAFPPPAVRPEFPHDPTPSIPEQRRVVNAAQEVAIHYAGSLPDFLCTETILRYDDVRGFLQLNDTVLVRLGYLDGHENYRVLSINGKLTMRTMEELGGAVSEGEFGSMLASLFVPDSKTVFRWDHWTTIRKRIAHVYTFRIPVEHAAYRMQVRAGPRDALQSVLAGQHGFVYIDRETNQILRILSEADVPANFPVRESATLLDYDFTTIAGRRFLLPVRADVRMATDRLHTRNVVEFRDYRKFTGESTITFQ